ncbi:MAG: hypothetical protein JEY94_17265 [Melioribacteraceae bacterium]|nr:hypothetical protein [Melioribacteraceae bacterium]
MKKIIISIQFIIIFLFFILLKKYFWVEEIFLLFIFPIVLIFIISAPIIFTIKIFKKINLKKVINNSFVGASLLQVFLCLFILWSISPRVYSKNQVSNDIDNAMVLMEDIHPNLYSTIDKTSLANIIDSLKYTMPQEVTDVEVYKTFGSIISNIKDGHTTLDMDNYLKRGSILFRKVLPCNFRIIGDKIYILKNYYIRRNIPIGSEVLTINNKPAAQCLDEISQLISYETMSFRDAWLQLPIIWGMWNNFKDFNITYRTPNNIIESVTASTGLLANISYLWDLTGKFGTENYRFEILTGNIGYINLKAFNDLDHFKTFLKSTFDIIKKNEVDNLIIDIRKSGGGSSLVLEELMQYISPIEYATFDTSLIKISKHLILENSLDTTIFKQGALFDEEPAKIALGENPLRFDGSCYVLTSGYSFSTASDFAAMVRCLNLGKIIGSETGGRTTSFGSPTNIPLPETEIIISVSRKKFVNVCGVESQLGIIPDIIIENTIEDDINGIDSVLDFTILLIKKSQQ